MIALQLTYPTHLETKYETKELPDCVTLLTGPWVVWH